MIEITVHIAKRPDSGHGITHTSIFTAQIEEGANDRFDAWEIAQVAPKLIERAASAFGDPADKPANR